MSRSNNFSFFPAFGVLLLIFSGCRSQKPSPMAATVALVNDEPISIQELQEAFSETHVKGLQGMEATSEEKELLKRRLLDQMVERKMLLQEARRLKIELTEGEMQERLAEIRGGMDDAVFQQYLGEKKLAKEDWERSARETFLVEKLLNQLVGDEISLPEEELLHYYDSHLPEWEVPERIRLRQILLEKEEEALTIRTTLLEGRGDFGEAAQSNAQTLQFGKDGDLGYRTAAELPAEFEPFFTAAIGTVSEVIKTPFGFHLLRMEDRQPAHTLTFEEVKERIHQTLLDEKREILFARWLENVRRKTEVKINEELLQKVS
ncbi:MAG: peptidyl-prolyl cis-trans isomerase [Candidatus Manganitrophaceae bacterium]